MTAGGREAFVTTYLKSREGSTLKSYESGFRTLRKICQEKDLSIFRLHEEDRCIIMIEAVERGLSEAAFKQMMAGVAMINESLGDKQMEGSRLEKKFRKAVTKEMNLTKKRKKKRSPGMWSDVWKLIELARGGQNKVHWVTAMLALVYYTGIRRFSDINRLQVKDVCFKSDGTLEFLHG